jgi:hypothetical protein
LDITPGKLAIDAIEKTAKIVVPLVSCNALSWATERYCALLNERAGVLSGDVMSVGRENPAPVAFRAFLLKSCQVVTGFPSDRGLPAASKHRYASKYSSIPSRGGW